MAKGSIKISLTDFVDFVTKSGGSKLTKVKQIKERGPYSPATDFYKLLRDKIIEIHADNLGKAELDSFLLEISDPKKIKNYPDAIKGYKKFWGRKKIQWFDPPFKHWLAGDVEVKINPELGLEFEGKFYCIKLYFKSDKLASDKIQIILSLMESKLRKEVEEEMLFGLLDVKNAKLFLNDKKETFYMPLLEGEIKNFETIWKAL